LVVDTLGNQVRVPLAGSVEEVELLAPIALALRLEAVAAGRLGLVALEMALPTCQAAGTCSLGFVVWCRIAGSLPRGQWLARRRVIVGWWCSRVGHADVSSPHAARGLFKYSRCAVGRRRRAITTP
jgi:hypothetical protein